MKRVFAILALLSIACPVRAQQPHAPPGGMYYNGRFYQGGQFVPRGAAGGVVGPSLTPADWAALMPPAPLAKTSPPRTARTTYRVKARHSARGTGSGAGTSTQAPDEDAQAKSRISMARNLVKLGKYEDARGWLDKVIEIQASVATVQEAQELLSQIEKRTGRSTQARFSGNRSHAIPEGANREPQSVAAPASPRYYARTSAKGASQAPELSLFIDVLESLEGAKAIGTATQSGSSDDGNVTWSLTVHGTAVPGRFVIVDREFNKIQD